MKTENLAPIRGESRFASTRVALINAPASIAGCSSRRSIYFPIALLSVGAALRQQGIEVRIFDLNNIQTDSFEDYLATVLAPELSRFQPQAVGIGGLFSGAWPYQKLIAQCARRAVPGAGITLGGIHATMFAHEILERYPFIDYVVIGEGEFTAQTLLARLCSGESVADIDGLAYRAAGQVKLNPKTQFADLDLLPPPDYSLIDVRDYNISTESWWSPRGLPVGQPFPVLTSRSCPKRCSFCSMHLVHGPRIRHRSPVSVVDEIEHLHKRYGATYFEIMDDNLTYNRDHVFAFCSEILRRKLKIQFCTPNGVAVKGLDREVVGALVEAGLVRVCLAIESGSTFIRNKAIGKGLSDEEIWSAVEACNHYPELFSVGFFVLGMPQETVETLQESVSLATRLPLDKAQVFFATPYPGTALHRLCVREGLIGAVDLLESPGLKNDTDTPHFIPAKVSVSDLTSARETVLSHYRSRRTSLGIPDNQPFRYQAGGTTTTTQPLPS
jgi:anaerobic magnesium-protoporphyrin IX monomethyl ester cyclase